MCNKIWTLGIELLKRLNLNIFCWHLTKQWTAQQIWRDFREDKVSNVKIYCTFLTEFSVENNFLPTVHILFELTKRIHAYSIIVYPIRIFRKETSKETTLFYNCNIFFLLRLQFFKLNRQTYVDLDRKLYFVSSYGYKKLCIQFGNRLFDLIAY